MNKTVFANSGTADQGKSSTIIEIFNLLNKKYRNSIEIIFSSEWDITAVVTIGKIKIGIESQGDPNSRLLNSLKYFVKINCDIIICSTRTSGTTVDAVNALNKRGYNIVWVTNYRSKEKDHKALNKISANHIFKLIQQNMTGII